MRRDFARRLGIPGIVLLFAVMGNAEERVRVRGQLQVEPGKQRGPLQVELIPTDGGLPPECVPASGNGDFVFDDLEPGDYQLVVRDHRGAVVHQEWVILRGESFLTVRIREEAAGNDASGTVSLRQLQRKIPGAALRELHKSTRAFAGADYPQAVSHLQKAIGKYPDYAEAHNDLGVCYARMQQLREALLEFEKACELDPHSATANSNLAAALLQSGEYADAERAARRAVKADPLAEFSHLVLGLSLAALNRGGPEALQSLRRAAARFPQARLATAEILHRAGHVAEATAELRLYLKTPASEQSRQYVESWLARLQNRGQTESSPAGQ